MHKNFRTILPPLSYPFKLRHTEEVLCLGSCFAEHIGSKLHHYQFGTCQNPFGILYNPVSLFESIEYLLEDRSFYAEDLFEYQEKWHSFAHHSRYSHPEQEAMLNRVNKQVKTGAKAIRDAKVLVITFGTAFAFRHRDLQKVVGNCHKLPADHFERFMLQPEEIIERGQKLFKRLEEERPDIQVLMSVSPIRHVKDGLVENQRSKSSLHLAVAQFCTSFDFVHYFPAYELLQDDLRDYRFYSEDLIHPAPIAIDYIWQYFTESLFAPSTQAINRTLDQIYAACNHRPFHPQTNAHQQFIRQQLEKIEKTVQQYPFLDLGKERKSLLDQRIEKD